MLRDAPLSRRCAYNQRAIRRGFGYSREHARRLKDMRSADGGDRFPERDVVRIDQTKVVKTEVRDRAGGGADVQRVAGRNQDNREFRTDKKLPA
jgi:hypothetical protein